MATVTHTQVRTLVGSSASVVDTVTAATGLPLELFLYTTVDDTYAHIASIAELYTYPVGKSAAVAAGKSYYRSATTTRLFSTIQYAQEWAAFVPATFKRLAVEWAITAPFVGTTTETITG
jgi:hypothetical protein